MTREEGSLKYFYSHAAVPGDRAVIQHVERAGAKLHDALRRTDPKALSLSEYNQHYLSRYLGNLRSVVQRTTYLFACSVAKYSLADLPGLVFVEYGGGTGLLALLAKAAGLGNVIYNDIYDVSCRDAERLARAIGLGAEHYVEGDIDALVDYVRRHGLQTDVVASCNVIEHVYDVDHFLTRVSDLSSARLSVVASSDANQDNPVVKRALVRAQLRLEASDRSPTWGFKERDSLRAYVNIRRSILADAAPGLSPNELDDLARSTRGLSESDIRKCAAQYVATGAIDYRPDHPTNTCDPLTGNWAEHLMDPGILRQKLAVRGFDARVLAGYYGSSKNPARAAAARSLNLMIRATGPFATKLAPYYVLQGHRS